MTLEEILKCDVSVLQAMTDEELEKHFEQYFPTTRPERVSQNKGKATPLKQFNPKLEQGLELLKQLGIDATDTLTPYKKGKK